MRCWATVADSSASYVMSQMTVVMREVTSIGTIVPLELERVPVGETFGRIFTELTVFSTQTSPLLLQRTPRRLRCDTWFIQLYLAQFCGRQRLHERHQGSAPPRRTRRSARQMLMRKNGKKGTAEMLGEWLANKNRV